MKALHEKVNIIPLIAKADCLTPNEIKKLKDRVSLHLPSPPQEILPSLLYVGKCIHSSAVCVCVCFRYERK